MDLVCVLLKYGGLGHSDSSFLYSFPLLLVASLLLVVRPGALSSIRSLLVAMPFAPRSVLFSFALLSDAGRVPNTPFQQKRSVPLYVSRFAQQAKLGNFFPTGLGALQQASRIYLQRAPELVASLLLVTREATRSEDATRGSFRK